ncbi:MAG: glutamine--tRNA ligase/YqeY domain fusion protein [Phycisphaera sp.]|nr:glutamine--tRNA ligase/YqeY domain fusion protein [Phycisphaera sp.]
MNAPDHNPSNNETTPTSGGGRLANFIDEVVEQDLSSHKHGGKIVTRFPPEPNGYLHIGHAKSICLNFGTALKHHGVCHLRMDDTNPTKEEQHYIDMIQRDVRWLGFDWSEHEYHASDYFDALYDWATKLIEAGRAYVCDLPPEEVSKSRGTLTTPGRESPFRGRTAQENLDLFTRMRNGEFPDGSRTLRAKIDMAAPNLNLRDPVMYRILHAKHPRTGDKWAIYPMYDWAHGQSDWIEGVTHSICTLEFEDHKPLYEWYIDQLQAIGVQPQRAISKAGPYRPRQYEFARLNLTYTVMSKRKLLELVRDKHVHGWDDPRMPTISGMRRRGYPPSAIRGFCDGIGVARRENTLDISRLQFHVREELNKTAPRRMAVLDPLRVVITNYPEGQTDELDAVNNPENPAAGSRKVPFARELFIEREDFMEDPPRKFFRLAPGREVRLRYAYFITCQEVVKDASGGIQQLNCTYDPATRGGDAPDGRKVKATLHWVSAEHALDAEVRLYDHLFTKEDPEDQPEGKTYLDVLNPDSLKVVTHAKTEPSAANTSVGEVLQFERLGYFALDPDSDTAAKKPVFNRTVTLKDTWAKVQAKAGD